jgi:hypothetical protein
MAQFEFFFGFTRAASPFGNFYKFALNLAASSK